ncbi:MAG: hypothetical protein JW904_04420 [Spirochaetales bacterium]|nr:hypothetical protein [Spirochaetales bacterium]
MKKGMTIFSLFVLGIFLLAGCNSAGDTKPQEKALATYADGSTEAYALYQLTDHNIGTAKGGVVAKEQNLVNVYVKNYAEPGAPTSWSPVPQVMSSQRLTILGGTWPGETAPDPERYTEFAVSPIEGKTFTADSISVYGGGGGGNNMKFSISIGTKDDFSDAVEILKVTSNPKNTMKLYEAPVSATVKSGETLYIRFYPWYTDNASGKYLCISELKIHGKIK